MVHVNLLGPQKVFLSRGGEHNYLKLKLPNTVQSIGAKIAVTLSSGAVVHQTFVVGEGLCSDQSHILNFGLGKERAIAYSVRFLNGRVVQDTGSFANQLLTL